PAPGDGVTVSTPVGTLGIRGTFGGGGGTATGAWTIALLPEEDGSVGRIVFVNLGGDIVLDEAFEGIEVVSFNELPPGTKLLSIDEIYALLGAALEAVQDDQMNLPIDGQIRNEIPSQSHNNSGSGDFGSLLTDLLGGDLGIDPVDLLAAIITISQLGGTVVATEQTYTIPPVGTDEDPPIFVPLEPDDGDF